MEALPAISEVLCEGWMVKSPPVETKILPGYSLFNKVRNNLSKVNRGNERLKVEDDRASKFSLCNIRILVSMYSLDQIILEWFRVVRLDLKN